MFLFHVFACKEKKCNFPLNKKKTSNIARKLSENEKMRQFLVRQAQSVKIEIRMDYFCACTVQYLPLQGYLS